MDTKPSKIDIYVDGSALYPGKENPAIAGGWGAVIVEQGASGKKTRFIGGSTPDSLSTSYQAEMRGISSALNDIKSNEYRQAEKPTIILHTDQESVVQHINAVVAGKPPIIKGTSRFMLDDIEAVAKELHVAFVYEKDLKGRKQPTPDEAIMNNAHRIASVMAWSSRLQRQGYIHLRGQGRLEGEAALQAITPSWLLTTDPKDINTQRLER